VFNRQLILEKSKAPRAVTFWRQALGQCEIPLGPNWLFRLNRQRGSGAIFALAANISYRQSIRSSFRRRTLIGVVG
jgi:hypothetical protein